MRPYDPSPADLLICQPAVSDPTQLDFALGVQHAWLSDLLERDVSGQPVLLGRPVDSSGAQMLYHQLPLTVDTIRRMYGGIRDGLPAVILQSQLTIAHRRVCGGSARLCTTADAGVAFEVGCVEDVRALLDWVDSVVVDVCAHFQRRVDAPRWQDTYETSDPREAVYLLYLSGATIRENLCLLDEPVLLGNQRLPLASYVD